MLSTAMQLDELSKDHLYPEQAQSAPVPRLADVIDEIVALIHRHVVLPDPSLETLLAVWISGTYLYERFCYFGYIALRSATPGCGKSQLLRLIARLSLGNPKITVAPTAAALFRSKRKILILDEVDNLRNQDKETHGQVLAILNAGFEKCGTVERVERTGQGQFEPVEFPVYGPKALAGIESLADTLASRCFMIEMQRSPHRAGRKRMNERRLETAFSALRMQMEAWVSVHGIDVEEAYTSLEDETADLAGYEDRFQDIAEPLLVIATLADAERPEGPSVQSRLISSLKFAAGRREPSKRECQLKAILDIAEARLGSLDEVFISSSEFVGACQEREDLEWIDKPKALANLLKHFELKSDHNTTKTARGYRIRAEWVREWRARYR